MRTLWPLILALALVLGFAPASPTDTPVLSDNIEIVGAHPDASIISTEFFSDEPVMVASTLTGVRTYDVSDPEHPQLLGAVPMAMFQNENIKLGERDDGTKLALVGYDAAGASPTSDPTDVGGYDELVVIDVTDPTDPTISARLETNTRTHTIGCANAECTHAFTSGDSAESGDEQGSFDVIDLSELTDPKIVATVEGTHTANDSFSSPIGHDWDVDAAGIAWWVGTGGIAAYDVGDPTEPVLLNSSDEHSTESTWNSYVSHNSQRPNAEAFRHHPGQGRGPDGNGPPGGEQWGASGAPDPDSGNVLLVTEEELSDNTCDDQGGFQTWHVPDLNPAINPDAEPEAGTITPLDEWQPELPQTGANLPVAAFCSAHYFEMNEPLEVVAQGWYQQGLRFLDYSDPENIEQVGYYLSGSAQETWGASWVPEYDDDGSATGELTDLVYTEDPTRGMEILRVDLEGGGDDEPREAPIPARILDQSAELMARVDDTWGGACLLPPAAGS